MGVLLFLQFPNVIVARLDSSLEESVALFFSWFLVWPTFFHLLRWQSRLQSRIKYLALFACSLAWYSLVPRLESWHTKDHGIGLSAAVLVALVGASGVG